METPKIIADQFLQEAFETTRQTRDRCLKLIQLSEERASAERTSLSEGLTEILREQKALFSYLARLRGLNRNAVHRVRQTKQETSEARAEIDTLHLHLQNLYYEQRHLRGEINACESYR